MNKCAIREILYAIHFLYKSMIQIHFESMSKGYLIYAINPNSAITPI